MKRYELSITKGYCNDWTVENALREIFQNQLDSEASGSHSYGDEQLEITNYGVSIPSKTLLMGVTTKRGDNGSVGGKGEGFKLAVGILLREGLEVEILNGPVKWVPSFQYSQTFEEDILVIDEYDLPQNDDITFLVKGVTEDVWDNVVEECLYLRTDITDTLEGPNGTVIKDFGGKIYVGGLFVTNEPTLQFSYDFHPRILKLNRDRKSVDNWDLLWETSRLLEQVMDAGDIATLMELGVADVKSGAHHYGSKVKDACYELFKEKSNTECVVVDYEMDKDAAKERYKATPVILNSSSFATMIKGSSQYSSYLEEVKRDDVEDEDERDPVDVIHDLRSSLIPYLPEEGLEELNKVIDMFEERGVSWYG